MEFDACLEQYIQLTGRDDVKETVFFEDTPDIIGIYAPGWEFFIDAQNKGYIGRAVCRSGFYSGQEIKIENKDELQIPPALEREAIIASLSQKETRGQFIFCLLAGRMLLVEEHFGISGDVRGDWKITRDNIIISYKDDEKQAFEISVDDKEYARFNLTERLIMDYDYQEFAELLLKFSAPAKTSVAQEELLLRLLEKYPEFEDHLIKRLCPDNHNICIYQMNMPAPESGEKLWLYFDNESAGIGVYPFVLCDDIGLHIDAVSEYIDSVINEEILLIKQYKSKEDYEQGKAEKYEWATPPKSGEVRDLEARLVKKAGGLSKFFKKRAYIVVFSYKGTYSFAIAL